MVDKPKVDAILSRLGKYARALKALGSVPREEFLANSDKIGNAKYHFIVAIECCIDLANHIIASERFRVPGSHADSFAVLLENGLLSAELADSLRAMARFRNRLVHLYWDVDDQLVAGYLATSLDDFEHFARAVTVAFP